MKRRRLIGFSCFLIASICFAAAFFVFSPNTKSNTVLLIEKGASFEKVLDSLDALGVLKCQRSFAFWAQLKLYPKHIKEGRYEIKTGMSNRKVVNKLISGSQDPIKLVLRKYRTLEDLIESMDKQFMFSKQELGACLYDTAFLSNFSIAGRRLDPQTAAAVFLPDTYFVFWNIEASAFFKKMLNECLLFWESDKHMDKAIACGLHPLEVSTLASIVDEETNLASEKNLIASVYLNRLRKGMLLQADPTVKFACADFSLKRILKEHLQIESPYNTYKNKGLPPGPINTPSKEGIKAVLKNTKTSYLYFCASPDFSGKHIFAETYSEHLQNAKNYHKALNTRAIY